MSYKQAYRRDNRQPWPDGSAGHIEKTRELLRLMGAQLVIVIERGVKKRNYVVIDNFLGQLEETALDISHECGAVMLLMAPDRKGRHPVWYRVANDLYDSAIRISELGKRVEKSRRRNRELNVGYLIGLIGQEFSDMVAQIDLIKDPRPTQSMQESSLSFWAEALEDIENL